VLARGVLVGLGIAVVEDVGDVAEVTWASQPLATGLLAEAEGTVSRSAITGRATINGNGRQRQRVRRCTSLAGSPPGCLLLQQGAPDRFCGPHLIPRALLNESHRAKRIRSADCPDHLCDVVVIERL